MRKSVLIFGLLISVFSIAQELNGTVSVSAQLTGNTNNKVFKTLEGQLMEFINNTQWTDKQVKTLERIECSFVINVESYQNDNFSASLQIQASRPIFGSTFSSPIYTFNDKDFQFQYIEFQNMVYNPNQYESNLVSVLSFHIYMILGMDADTFEENGGSTYFRQAQTIANYSLRGGQGWRLEDGLQSRFALIDNILSPTYKEFRRSNYTYHREGLDMMHENLQLGKKNIASAIEQLETIHKQRPNSFLMRLFFDSKANEVADIFNGGPKINSAKTISILNKIAPLHSLKWNSIRF